MLPRFGCTIDDIIALFQFLQEVGNLVRWVLEVIVHRHDGFVLRRADAREQRIMLSIVAH